MMTATVYDRRFDAALPGLAKVCQDCQRDLTRLCGICREWELCCTCAMDDSPLCLNEVCGNCQRQHPADQCRGGQLPRGSFCCRCRLCVCQACADTGCPTVKEAAGRPHFHPRSWETAK